MATYCLWTCRCGHDNNFVYSTCARCGSSYRDSVVDGGIRISSYTDARDRDVARRELQAAADRYPHPPGHPSYR